MKTKLITIALAAIMLLTLLAGCGETQSNPGTATTAPTNSAATDSPNSGNSDADSTVTVGIMHSLTGPMAISEQSVVDAEVLAINEINASGGVLGKQIKYIKEDGASEPSVFATKAEKLLGQDNVATVFGCWTSSSRKAVKSVFEDYGGLLWYPVQYEGMEQSPNIIYTGAAPNQQIVPAIEYLIDNGYTKFFLLGSDYVFPRTANMIIKAQVEAAGYTVVGEEYAAMDQTDFSSIVAKIESAKPDVIVNTLNGTGNVSFFKQMSEKGYDASTYMTMSFSIAEEEVRAIGASILKDHLVSWNYYQTTATSENDAFVAAYKAAYGSERVTSDPAEAAYDAVYLWKAAVEKAGSFDVDSVLAAIREGGISFQAPEGKVEIDASTQHLSKPVRIGVIEETGLIREVYATADAVVPDPYLKSYDWAVSAGIQPLG
jgi:urea transport system substrate-binding protein